jgi:hypothetical protein
MTHSHSLVIVVPAEHKATVEEAGVALGHSGNEYSVALSATGSEPATHFGLQAWATPETAYAWTEAEEVPPLTAEQLAWLRAILTISDRTDIGAFDHFMSVIGEMGLSRILAEETL